MEASLEQQMGRKEVVHEEQSADPIAFKTVIQGFLFDRIGNSVNYDATDDKKKREELMNKWLKLGEWFEEEVVTGERFDKYFLDIFGEDKQSTIRSIGEKFSAGWKKEDIEEGTPIWEFIKVIGSAYMPEVFPEMSGETASVVEFKGVKNEQNGKAFLLDKAA